MAFRDTLVKVSRLFQPNGTAYRMPEGGVMEKLYKAIMSDNIGGFGRAYKDMRQIGYDILPDNPYFTIDEARRWYKRLGLYDSGDVSLADMKLAIAQKMSWAQVPLAKQNYLFIQQQLRAAGFDVYVYPNRFSDGLGGWITKTPIEILSGYVGDAALDGFYLDDLELDETWSDDNIWLIMNYQESEKDEDFYISPDGWKSTFYIAGATVDAFADVPAGREIEFRQLVLKLKAAQMCAIAFVNYT